MASAHTGGTIIRVVTADAPSRHAAVAAVRAIVSGALRQRAPRTPAGKPAMTAVARGLSEHPLPDLVMAGCAGDPHVTLALAALGSLPGSHAVAIPGFAKRAGSRKPEAPSRGVPW